MNHNITYIQNTDILWQEVHGEYVLLDPKNSKSHELNEMAFNIWTQLKEPLNLSGLIVNILENYDVSEEKLQIDMGKVLRQMMDQKLILIENDNS